MEFSGVFPDDGKFLFSQTQKIGKSLVAASEDDTGDWNGKSSTPAHLPSSTSTIITTGENLHLAIISVLRMLHLPRDQQICLGLNRTAFVLVQFCIFAFEYVQACFVSISHLRSISSPQCADIGSAELFNDPFFSHLTGAQFANHITCLAPAVLFQFEHTLSHFTCFTHIHTFFSLNMSEYILFIFMFHVVHLLARLSRAIQHNFSGLAGALFTDCYICLSSTHFVWVCTNHAISPVYLYLGLHMSIYVLFRMFRIFLPQRAPTGPAE